ncbi:MAG TPA: sugar ABC transporter substrate-binding protein [Mycobacteriales bacterium]
MRISVSRTLGVLTAVAALATTAACGSGFDNNSATPQKTGKAHLNVLVATSGTADLDAVRQAAAKWAASTGSTATVSPAQDMNQQLTQGFASGKPPDVFMVDATQFEAYAKAGDLEPYGQTLSYRDDLYPTLRQSFTLDGTLYCAPKDFSTLALEINNAAWQKAGLTDADVPTTWDQLETVARKLTTGKQVGLALGDTRDRIGAFMVQAGGWVTSDDQRTATADTPANLEALQFVQKLLAEGVAKYPKQLDSGWSGEAFGKGRAAMAIEGNWLRGAMKTDYPDISYRVVPLPSGPKSQGTLSFTQCWGVAAKSQFKQQAIDLVNSFMTPEQQMVFADAFGVMPSRMSVRAEYQQKFPQDAAFLDGADYARGPVTAPTMNAVLADFDTGLQGLPQADPEQILRRLQKHTADALQH